MLYLGYSIFVIILTIGFAWMKRESIFSPMGITASAWLFVFILGSFFYESYFPFTDKIFLMWLCWFGLSSFCYLAISPGKSDKNLGPVKCMPFDYSMFLILLILGLVYKTWEIGNIGPGSFLVNLRLATIKVTNDAPSIGLVGNFYPLIFSLFIFESFNACKYNRRLRWLLWIWMLIFAVTTMGKFALITPVSAWIIIKHRRREINFRKLTLIAIAMILLMIAIHYSRATVDYKDTLLEVLSIYSYSPIIALGELDVSGKLTEFAEYTFRFYYAIKYYFVGGIPPVETILNFVYVPVATNVYTVMQPFYTDHGFVGIIYGALFYGLFYGLLHRYYLKGRQLAIICYAAFSISLITQFLGETLITNFSGNLQIIIAAILVVSLSRERKMCQ
jgi:oligosaccharide repeat unit polymerase